MGIDSRPLPCAVGHVWSPSPGYAVAVNKPRALHWASHQNSWRASRPSGRNVQHHRPPGFKTRWRKVSSCLSFWLRWRLAREKRGQRWRADRYRGGGLSKNKQSSGCRLKPPESRAKGYHARETDWNALDKVRSCVDNNRRNSAYN